MPGSAGRSSQFCSPGTDLADGPRFAEAIRAELAKAHDAAFGIDTMVTASFGVTQMASDDTLTEMSRRAD